MFVLKATSGSIKANIGHLEAASGLAAVLRSILILEKGIIPGNALFEKLNPSIEAAGFNVEVCSGTCSPFNISWLK